MNMTPKRASEIATILLHAHSRYRSDVDVFDQFFSMDGGVPTLEEWMFVGKSIDAENSPVFVNIYNALSSFERHDKKPQPRLTEAYIKRKVALAKTAAMTLKEQVEKGSPTPSPRGGL